MTHGQSVILFCPADNRMGNQYPTLVFERIGGTVEIRYCGQVINILDMKEWNTYVDSLHDKLD